jgi:hypothetical protein
MTVNNSTLPPEKHATVTPSDTVDFDHVAREIYVGGAGNIALVTEDDTAVTYSSVPAGSFICGVFKRVNNTGTTAANIVARW